MRVMKQVTETLRTCDPRKHASATWGRGRRERHASGELGQSCTGHVASPAVASRMASTPIAARIVCAPQKTRAFSLIPQYFPGRCPPKHETLPGVKFQRRWVGEPSAP